MTRIPRARLEQVMQDHDDRWDLTGRTDVDPAEVRQVADVLASCDDPVCVTEARALYALLDDTRRSEAA